MNYILGPRRTIREVAVTQRAGALDALTILNGTLKFRKLLVLLQLYMVDNNDIFLLAILQRILFILENRINRHVRVEDITSEPMMLAN